MKSFKKYKERKERKKEKFRIVPELQVLLIERLKLLLELLARYREKVFAFEQQIKEQKVT